MAMAGATPKHLYKIGLIDELVEDDELDVNFLMSQSLITISTLPFHLGREFISIFLTFYMLIHQCTYVGKVN